MRFRSAGLGPTELKGSIAGLSPEGQDLLVLHINTTEPVQWHLKAAMERKDVLGLIKGILQPAVLFHILRTLLYIKKNPREIKDIMDKSVST